MSDLISVTIDSGKYTIRQTAPGKWECLRHGEPWPAYPDGPGNLEVALAYEVDNLRQYRTWYEEAQLAANEAGYGPGSAADAIRSLSAEIVELREALSALGGAK